MKKLLTLSVAGSALLAAGCTTAAMANDDHDVETDIRVIVADTDHSGPSVIIRGVEIDVVDGDVIINGDAVSSTEDGRVIISGGNATVIRGGDHAGNHSLWVTDNIHEFRLAEIEADAERMAGMRVMFEGRHDEEFERAMEALELDMEELDGQRFVVINGERRELTDEEREELRVELQDAREEIQNAMIEVRRELEEGQAERREGMRVLRFELANTEREAAEAERMMFIARGNQEASEDILVRLREGGGQRLRFESENGEERIWVDGQEIEGDARAEWLERLEIERLEGGEGRSGNRVIIEINEDEE
ncbi:MAG: hypothetical protein DHS20C06_12480 [Hyphobacterium sp.]|nr:MAG: hypothetical protein DHS20C06_12480 [Hyphobacterium sp.]